MLFFKSGEVKSTIFCFGCTEVKVSQKKKKKYDLVG